MSEREVFFASAATIASEKQRRRAAADPSLSVWNPTLNSVSVTDESKAWPVRDLLALFLQRQLHAIPNFDPNKVPGIVFFVPDNTPPEVLARLYGAALLLDAAFVNVVSRCEALRQSAANQPTLLFEATSHLGRLTWIALGQSNARQVDGLSLTEIGAQLCKACNWPQSDAPKSLVLEHWTQRASGSAERLLWRPTSDSIPVDVAFMSASSIDVVERDACRHLLDVTNKLSAGSRPERIHITGPAAKAFEPLTRAAFPSSEIVIDATGTRLVNQLVRTLRPPTVASHVDCELLLRPQLPRLFAGASFAARSIWPKDSKVGKTMTTEFTLPTSQYRCELIYLSQRFPQGQVIADLNQLGATDFGQQTRVTARVRSAAGALLLLDLSLNGDMANFTFLVDPKTATNEVISKRNIALLRRRQNVGRSTA